MRIWKSKLTILAFMLIITILSVYSFSIRSENTTSNEILSSYQKTKINQIPEYKFDISYDENKKSITGSMKILVPNNSEDEFNELYFHLYPNVFANWKWGELSKPKTEGSIIVKEATVNQVAVVPHQNETLLKLNLPKPLKPNELAEVALVFELKLPQNGLRLSHINNTTFLAQWYPMLAVYDDEGWHLDPYTTTGDPFFSEVANYEVHLDLPKGYYAVSTAEDPIQTSSDKQTVYLSQQKVRDFAIMISKDYNKVTGFTNNDIKVNMYYLAEHQEVSALLLGSAIEAMDFFETSFGEYPMEEIDVVLTDAGYGIAGMEYPGLVTSNPYTYGDPVAPAYNVVAHEIAHQWWYGVVGNNQVKEPWLDEGLTSFSEYLFMEQVLNKKDIAKIMEKYTAYTDEIAAKNKLDVLQSIYTYGDYYSYFVYGRPAAMLWELKEQYGTDKVVEILRLYYQKFQFKIATTEDFIQITNDVLEKDMGTFFDKWLIVE